MKFKMYAIYDTKAKAYLPPFILPEEGMAVRTFTNCINSENHQFGQNPSDYTLFRIAEFDDNTASVKSHAPEAVRTGVECIEFDPEVTHNVNALEAVQ